MVNLRCYRRSGDCGGCRYGFSFSEKTPQFASAASASSILITASNSRKGTRKDVIVESTKKQKILFSRFGSLSSLFRD
jgi:hypothetical protein